MINIGNTTSTTYPLIVQVKPGNTLFVAKNGNDSTGNGSENYPYLTIGAAITAATAGTNVIINYGSYTENITFAAGVNLISNASYGVYIIGNHTANFNGTVICQNIVFQNPSSVASGTTITYSGTSAQNLQMYTCFIVSQSSSGAGDAFSWTNTNAGSKFQFLNGNITVLHSNSTARAIVTSSTSAGSIILNKVTVQVDNLANVAISLNGAISYTHTSDAINGQLTTAGTGTSTVALCTQTTVGVPIQVLNSSGTNDGIDNILITNTTPAVTGSGAAVFAAIVYGGTGSGGSSTLNGGVGAIPLDFSPIKFRGGGLLPVASVAAGNLSGTLECDGTHLYITLGSTRYTVNVTAT